MSNIFWVKDETVYTPAVNRYILNGITRRWVLAWAKREGVRCYEGRFSISALTEAEEVFLTNSVQEIVPVCSFHQDDLRYTYEKREIYKRVRNDYSNIAKHKEYIEE